MKRKILSWLLWTIGWSIITALLYSLSLQFLIITTGDVGYFPLTMMEGLQAYIPFSDYVALPFMRFFIMFDLGHRFYEYLYLVVTTVYVKSIIDLIILIYRIYKNRKKNNI